MTNFDAHPIVETERGRVRGVASGTVAAFLGIPYAESPIGARRFRPPVRMKGWQDVRPAERKGPPVPQSPTRLQALMATATVPDWEESDCLNLNIWTPVAALSDGNPRPVLFWIHGGGFTSGSGGWSCYDGARLADLGDLVVVTINYRLGPLGYLYLPEIGADNLACQDQACALRWVADNISAFGGDAQCVTVGGQSAGAHSALALAASTQTRPLIQRLLLESGPFGKVQDREEAAARADEYLAILGLARNSDVGAALDAFPIQRLLDAYVQFTQSTAKPGDIVPPMYPVLEGTGMPPFLASIQAGTLTGMEILAGTTRNEMTPFYAFNPHIRDLDRAQAEAAAADLLGAGAQANYARIARMHPSTAPWQLLAEVACEEFFSLPLDSIAAAAVEHRSPVWLYRFDRCPQNDDFDLGAAHCAELPFLFNTFDEFAGSPLTGEITAADHSLCTTFAGACASFVSSGKPQGTEDGEWVRYPAMRLFDGNSRRRDH